MGKTLAISTYNRKNEVIQMAKSLKNLEMPDDINIRIYDDKSSEYGKEFLEELFPNAEINIREKNLKADRNMREIHKDFLKTRDDILIQVDSDVIYNKDFFKIIDNILSGKKSENIFSLYNSISHKEIENSEIEIKNIKFIEKKTIGGLCVIFPNRKIIEKIIENVPEGEAYDWRWSKYLLKNNKKIYVSQKSYIQHIGGLKGQNNNCDLNIDFGKQFIASNKNDLEFIENYEKKIVEEIMENRYQIPSNVLIKNLMKIKNLIRLTKFIIKKIINVNGVSKW